MSDESGAHSPQPRIGDADRDRVIELLKQHTAAGRLTLGEFSDRAGAVVAARTHAELDPIVADLPALSPAEAGPRRRTKGRWTVAVMGDSKQTGRWRVGERSNVVSVMGDVSLDLTKALFSGSEIVMTAMAVMGDVEVIVPVGMEVELTGVPLLGENRLKIRDGIASPGLPLLRVRAFTLMGDVTVRTAR